MGPKAGWPEMSAHAKMATPDLDQARRFLERLDLSGTFTFQMFSDTDDMKIQSVGSGRKVDPNAKWLHGSIDQHASSLASANARGVGIFVMVNDGNGKGRNSESVVRVRALFLDLDGAPLQPVLDTMPAPHILVNSSPDRWHIYWLVSDCELGDFRRRQEQLIERFGGDKAVKDLPRVMR